MNPVNRIDFVQLPVEIVGSVAGHDDHRNRRHFAVRNLRTKIQIKESFFLFYFTGFLQSFYRVSRGLPYLPYHKPPEVSSGFFPGYKRVFTGFPISIQGSMSFNSSIDGFYRVLLGFTGFY